MDYLKELELPFLIIAVVANISLAVIVLRYATKNESRNFFVLYALTQIVWIVINYFAVRSSPDLILTMARFTIVAAVPHPILLFLFVRSFINPEGAVRLSLKLFSVGLVVLLSGLALSPFLFTHVEIIDRQPTPVAGPGMGVFGLYVLVLLILSFWFLIKSWKSSQGIERKQKMFIAVGLLCTLTLIVIFNFIAAVVFEQLVFVRFGHMYTLPFVILTAYAMVKHHLLNIKTVAAELGVILFNLIIFIQLFNAQSYTQFIISASVFVGALAMGSLVLRGLYKEIEQRERLQRLTEQLEKTNDQLEAANEKLKQLDVAKTEFLSITSHQLRTPLTGIKGYLSMMLEGDFGAFVEKQSEVLARVSAEVDRLARMVQVFLNVSRIESGRLIIGKVEFDLMQMAQTVVKELTPLAEKKGLKLSFAGPHELKAVADPDKLKDVVMNLVDNAIKYTAHGTIHVKVEQHDNEAQVSVIDTGVGIDPGETGKLFEKFSRGMGIAKVSAEGSGLGLFIVKKIVEGHGGRVWVESKGKEQGSTFAFVIPVRPPEPAQIS